MKGVTLMQTMLLAEASTTSMADAVSSVFTIASQALGVVTGNAVLMTFFCAGIIGVACGVISHLKHM